VNLQLPEARIRATCRELLKTDPDLSGRQLCADLRTRYGAVGKTTRVFRIWREEVATLRVTRLPGELALLKQKVHAAEAAAAEYLKRAELAEFREQAHQDHWALEVDRLRQEVAALRGPVRPFPV
jgi:hypothetical protein